MMDVYVFGAECAKGEEHDCAYRLLALALKQVYGIDEMPTIEREKGGKPYFPQRKDICFNLSHSHGAAVCAVHHAPIGVDIERLRPAPKRLASGMDDLTFFRLWTAKEASVKREGKGIAALLRDVTPDAPCQTEEEFMPGWIVTVCPSEKAEVRFVRI